MSFQDIMRRVLPPINGVQPHIPGPAGEFGAGEAEGRQPPSKIPHHGIDFNYFGGQNRLNKSHPALRAPVDGVVENAGQGTVGRIAIRDKDGFLHEILHTQARFVNIGDPVAAGQLIGTMGNTGVEDHHVHYQLKDPAGRIINPAEFWDQRGPVDPNPSPPSFLDESKRAAQIMSGGTTNPTPGAPSPDNPQKPFYSPFGQMIPAPADGALSFANRSTKFVAGPTIGLPPLPASQSAPTVPAVPFVPPNGVLSPAPPATFDERFRSLGSSLPVNPGDSESPLMRALKQYRRSDIPGGVAVAAAGTDPSAPILPRDAADETANAPPPVRTLGRRVVSLSGSPVLANAAPGMPDLQGVPEIAGSLPRPLWGLPSLFDRAAALGSATSSSSEDDDANGSTPSTGIAMLDDYIRYLNQRYA